MLLDSLDKYGTKAHEIILRMCNEQTIEGKRTLYNRQWIYENQICFIFAEWKAIPLDSNVQVAHA